MDYNIDLYTSAAHTHTQPLYLHFRTYENIFKLYITSAIPAARYIALSTHFKTVDV